MARFGADCGGDCCGLLAVGAGKIAEVDADMDRVFGGVRIDFGMDDGDGAEKEIGDVSEDGGATSGDEIGGEEFVELGDGVVDTHGGGEFVGVVGEALEEVRGRFCHGKRVGMFGAEAEFQVVRLGAATATGGSAVEAAIGGSG